ncbi:MAG: FAD-dependent oxidoreductase, partial [Paracoccaceae bacterium]|nr:FAD-dependent oxidoreductase [Paracoccaceae bacterium]
MKTRTKVVVIGGGIAGCSTLYHLTQEGWTDVVLVERNELTSGTTWHSAAQVTNFGMNQTMVGLKSHSIKLYQELAADPEYPINYHHGDGGIRLVKATIKKFVQYCDQRGVRLADRNFSVRYESNIPRQVGLAGSSAIIVATLRCLMEFYGVPIAKRVQPSLALSVETDELG